jgi:DNA-binding response OmpR family regulator
MPSHKKVVVVDDNEINAKMLEEFLIEKGYDVELALTAQEGLKKVTDTNPDLVIVDLFLPDMKGSQVCVQLRARKATQHIPIILCTAENISHKEKLKGFESGVDDYLVRPFELAELSARMEALLRRSKLHLHSEILAGIDALLKIPPQPKPKPEPVPTLAIKAATIIEKPGVRAPSSPTTFSNVTMSVPTAVDLQSFHPLRRVFTILNHPVLAFKRSKQHEDLLVSLMLVLGTPMIANITLSIHSGGAAWLGALGFKIAANVGAWFALAGVLQVTAPFLGKHWSFQRALSIAGLSWAPRALAAALSVFYAFWAPLFVARVADFSSGFALIPAFDKAGPLLSELNFFSLWSVGLVLVAVWTLSGTKQKWNSITMTIALIAFLCGMVAHV